MHFLFPDKLLLAREPNFGSWNAMHLPNKEMLEQQLIIWLQAGFREWLFLTQVVAQYKTSVLN